MKRAICALLIIACLLCGCASPEPSESTATDKTDYIKGVWFSYLELDTMLSGDFKAEFERAIEQCKSLFITDIFVHVRPFCDALYESELFPMRQTASGKDFDVLTFMLDTAHEAGIRFHAWINPYRVSRESATEALLQDNPAYRWLHSDSAEDKANVILSDGIYLNPASDAARRLVIDGVRELLQSYDVDGVHFDDYFYPSSDEAIDSEVYTAYCASTKAPLALGDWRRANVNTLISGVYTAVKFFNKDIVFSVSPAASVENNYNNLFADVETWVESGCVDMLIPQLYFGFDYPLEEYRFENLLKIWKKMAKKGGLKLVVGLAPYKIGTDAEADREEWNDNPTLLKKQTDICYRDQTVSGHVFYSYSSLFSESPQNKAAREALFK